mgnify:CR=1 FL=1
MARGAQGLLRVVFRLQAQRRRRAPRVHDLVGFSTVESGVRPPALRCVSLLQEFSNPASLESARIQPNCRTPRPQLSVKLRKELTTFLYPVVHERFYLEDLFTRRAKFHNSRLDFSKPHWKLARQLAPLHALRHRRLRRRPGRVPRADGACGDPLLHPAACRHRMRGDVATRGPGGACRRPAICQ